ncbi:hypothetical protein KPL70_022369 [Citrus sinensis]|nr:hypothetical protein KPL70_022369 [Citrus sinensis]
MAAPYLLLSSAFLLLLLSSNFSALRSHQTVATLPGFDGHLPFKLETGYIGVGDDDDVQLFYYFIESERSPEDDPLVLWLTGGPGCSGFSGLVFEIGPLVFDYESSRPSLPRFSLNQYSWTKVANVIFLDAPVGTGFSYANSWQGYIMNDTLSATQIYHFLRKWLVVHSDFLANPLYIAGDSYSGKIVPIVVQEISDGIDAGHKPRMNLKGYMLGNPVTDDKIDQNSKIQFAYLKALITYEIYECTGNVNGVNIYEPRCSFVSPKSTRLSPGDASVMEDEEDSLDLLFLPAQPAPKLWCRNQNYFYAPTWANDKTVQRALGIQEGMVKEWRRCNKSLSYTTNVLSSVDYHRNFIKKGYQVLIYSFLDATNIFFSYHSGDVDMGTSYVGTETWIKSLNLTIDSGWQPWLVDGQVAGEQVIRLQSTSLRNASK